jgi:hypothetical protein
MRRKWAKVAKADLYVFDVVGECEMAKVSKTAKVVLEVIDFVSGESARVSIGKEASPTRRQSL